MQDPVGALGDLGINDLLQESLQSGSVFSGVKEAPPLESQKNLDQMVDSAETGALCVLPVPLVSPDSSLESPALVLAKSQFPDGKSCGEHIQSSLSLAVEEEAQPQFDLSGCRQSIDSKENIAPSQADGSTSSITNRTQVSVDSPSDVFQKVKPLKDLIGTDEDTPFLCSSHPSSMSANCLTKDPSELSNDKAREEILFSADDAPDSERTSRRVPVPVYQIQEGLASIHSEE
eukprot:Gb_14599 [translate_table: standard]